jgi:hypothetical protein
VPWHIARSNDSSGQLLPPFGFCPQILTHTTSNFGPVLLLMGSRVCRAIPPSISALLDTAMRERE